MKMEYLNLSEINDLGQHIFYKPPVKQFDFSDFFEIDTTRTTRDKQIKEFINWCSKNNNNKVPKQYYEFLVKLMSYRVNDYRNAISINDISAFFIGKSEYGNTQLMFYTKNGRCDSVGINKCLTGLQQQCDMVRNNMKGTVIQVLRNISNISINEFKKNITFPTKSEISGIIINDKSEMHIDHYDKEFSEVAFSWLYLVKKCYEKNNKKFINVFEHLYKFIDDDYKYFKYDELNESFRKYHDNNTHLRITTKKENLSRTKVKPHWEYLEINGYWKEKYEKQKSNWK